MFVSFSGYLPSLAINTDFYSFAGSLYYPTVVINNKCNMLHIKCAGINE